MLTRDQLLDFGFGNRKLPSDIATFSIPSGFSCPGALECLCKANRETGKLEDGENSRLRCFSATQECVYPGVRKSRWKNFDLLRAAKTRKEMIELLVASMRHLVSPFVTRVRVHVGGDFYSYDYFMAWMEAARIRKDLKFYAYTKSIPFWVRMLDEGKPLPRNFKLVASYGGRHDNLIEERGLQSVRVVFHPDEAEALGLEVDHNDSLAYSGKKDFALVLHAQQPKGSEASEAMKLMRRDNIPHGYGRYKHAHNGTPAAR